MVGDNSGTNIIPLHIDGENRSKPSNTECDVGDVSDFIVDMLDTLMRIAAKKDHSLLVYFLAMARIEAMELKISKSDLVEKN